MLAGSATQLSRHPSAPDALNLAHIPAPLGTGPRGGVIWIAGVTGVARLVGLVRGYLEPHWTVELVRPAEARAWIDRADDERVAIVVASPAVASADLRAQADAAGLAFSEIRVVADWDAFVEQGETTLLTQVARAFVNLVRPDAPRRSVAAPEAVVRLDWQGIDQVRAHVSNALARVGLLDAPRSLPI